MLIEAEADGKLYIIDQHAAHERILYEKALAGPVSSQNLLVPLCFSTDSADADSFLKAKSAELSKFGFALHNNGDGMWQLDALPELWRFSDGDTVDEILNMANSGANFAEAAAASIACHSAIKEGDYLDAQSALELAAKALALPVKRCPHGRPILTEITRDELLRAVRRLD